MNSLEKYANKRFRSLKMLLKRYSSDEDVEILHGIRVEIKKIKAILQLVNAYAKGFPAHRHFTPLRDIFRKAGEIRQPQVFYELMLRYEIQGLSDSHIPGAVRQARLSRRFRKEIPVYISMVRARKDKLEKFLAKISAAQVKEYLKGRKKALRRVLQGNLSGSALHKARKAIKEILYLEAVVLKDHKREPYFHQLEELIGQWHDRQLLMEILKKENSPELERLTSERDRALREIIQSISNFYNRR